MFKIYPYKVGSRSVRALKERLNCQSIKLEGSRFRPRRHHTIINWGNSRVPDWPIPTLSWLNHPSNVALAANKLETFRALEEQGVSHVPFTTDIATAQSWLNQGKVYARHTTTGHSGEGIEVITPPSALDNVLVDELDSISSRLSDLGLDYLAEQVMNEAPYNPVFEPDLPRAPLYTKGISNNGEYRVHVFNGEVILYQKKSRQRDDDGNVPDLMEQEDNVRNLASGWVYRIGNLNRLERVEQLAIAAVEALGLDFGAVDIIKDNNGEVFVLEVNTAVGLGNQSTLEAYAEAFSGYTNN